MAIFIGGKQMNKELIFIYVGKAKDIKKTPIKK